MKNKKQSKAKTAKTKAKNTVKSATKQVQRVAKQATKQVKKAINSVTKPNLFKVVTKTGKSFMISNTPIPGGKKVTSNRSKKVIYVSGKIDRDQARVVYASYAKVPYTGISAKNI